MALPFLQVPPLVSSGSGAPGHPAISQTPLVFLSFHSEKKGKAGSVMGEAGNSPLLLGASCILPTL